MEEAYKRFKQGFTFTIKGEKDIGKIIDGLIDCAETDEDKLNVTTKLNRNYQIVIEETGEITFRTLGV